METLKHLISFFIKIAFGLFFMALVLWLVSLLFPQLSFKNIMPLPKGNATSTEHIDWLPSPRQYKSLFPKPAAQNEYTNVYVHGEPYNGYGDAANSSGYGYSSVGYVTYTATGTVTQDGAKYEGYTGPGSTGTVSGATQATTSRALYIRNLSLYQGGKVTQGLSFIGEARSSMFRNGTFPIVLVDGNRRVIGISLAYATKDWAVAGWTRFETRIAHPVPVQGPCVLIFEESLAQGENRSPIRVPLNVSCN